MRIAFVTLQYPPDGVGGIGTYVRDVATVLAADGHEVTVVCADGDQRRSSAVVDGVRVERFPSLGPASLRRRLVLPRQRLRVRLLAAASAAWAMRRLGLRFDVIEAPEFKAQSLLLRIARRGPVVVHVHLPLELEFAWNQTERSAGARVACTLERRAAVAAAARTATSRRSIERPDGSTWLPPASVRLVAPPLAIDRWTDLPAVSGTGPTVVFVGRLERRKAPEDLLEALAIVARDVPGLRCVMVGRAMQRGPDGYDDLLRDRAEQLGVDLELRGQIADHESLRAVYAEARVVAVPSRFETLSMVAFEALACGRPAVISDQTGAAELLGADLPELIVPAGEPSALAAALLPHLLDADHAHEVGSRGRALVRDLCSHRNIVESRLEVYRQVSDHT